MEQSGVCEERLVKDVTLSNGVKLSIYDLSRRVAGDRWFVALLARATFEAKEPFIPQGVSEKEVHDALGQTVEFTQKRERNFIDEKEKDEVFQRILESFMDGMRSYLSHPEFPSRFIAKKLAEHRKRASYGARQLERSEE